MLHHTPQLFVRNRRALDLRPVRRIDLRVGLPEPAGDVVRHVRIARPHIMRHGLRDRLTLRRSKARRLDLPFDLVGAGLIDDPPPALFVHPQDRRRGGEKLRPACQIVPLLGLDPLIGPILDLHRAGCEFRALAPSARISSRIARVVSSTRAPS